MLTLKHHSGGVGTPSMPSNVYKVAAPVRFVNFDFYPIYVLATIQAGDMTYLFLHERNCIVTTMSQDFVILSVHASLLCACHKKSPLQHECSCHACAFRHQHPQNSAIVNISRMAVKHTI